MFFFFIREQTVQNYIITYIQRGKSEINQNVKDV